MLALRDSYDRSDVDDFWSGARMLRAVSLVHIVGQVAPLLLVVMPSWEEACCALVAGVLKAGLLVRLYRVSQGDGVDSASAPFFVNSSLAPVLLFRGRLKSVADVLRGMKQHGFTQTRWDALQGIGVLCVVMALVPGALGWVDSPRFAWLLQVGFRCPRAS